jgi:gamma-glutamylcyclotransferase (GGCT)/AIG2-like uncharacterized protein YtfP
MVNYIFAYGSLINMKYRQELDKKDDRIIIPVYINKIQRHWIYCKNSKTYLGIKHDDKSKTNGLIIEVSDDELNRLDTRERYYNRIKLNPNDIDYNYDLSTRDLTTKLNPTNLTYTTLTENDNLFTYYPDPLKSMYYIYNKSNKETENYLIICLSGCLKVSHKFFVDFLLTTRGWS